jgi:hypothetical protein
MASNLYGKIFASCIDTAAPVNASILGERNKLIWTKDTGSRTLLSIRCFPERTQGEIRVKVFDNPLNVGNE